MDDEVFCKYYLDIIEALKKKELNAALHAVENLLYTNPTWPFLDEVISIRQAYQGMLYCLEQGFKDDDRNLHFKQLLLRTYKLLHKLNYHFMKEKSQSFFSKSMKTVEYKPFREYSTELIQLTQEAEKEVQYDERQEKILKEREELVHNLFVQVWTAEKLTDEDITELGKMLLSPEIEDTDKCTLMGAILLQQANMPCATMLFHLMVFSCSTEFSEELRSRALVTWVLILFMHEKQFRLDDSLRPTLQNIMQVPGMQNQLCEILISLCQSTQNEKEVDTTLNNLAPLLNNNYNNIDKVARKAMNKIRKVMTSGGDIGFHFFSHCKHYPFFKNIENWFRLFTAHHSKTVFMKQGKSKLMNNLQFMLNNPALCHNDKWSLFLNVQTFEFPINILGVDEGNLELTESVDGHNNQSILNYLHDLYRFFTLFSYHQEFPDLLKQEFSPSSHPFIYKQFDKEHQYLLASNLFDNKQYDFAKYLALKLLNEESYSEEGLKIIADCYRMTNDYEEAAKIYEKLFQHNHSKIYLYNIAYCYEKLDYFSYAAEIYSRLSEAEPDNLSLIKRLAICLIHKGTIDKAIQLLYKIAYYNKNYNDFCQRSLTWCYLLEGKLEEAWAAWERISKPRVTDWLNAGHIHWAMQDQRNAVQFYKKYLKESKDKKKAAQTMHGDLKVMNKYGFTNHVLKLILDLAL